MDLGKEVDEKGEEDGGTEGGAEAEGKAFEEGEPEEFAGFLEDFDEFAVAEVLDLFGEDLELGNEFFCGVLDFFRHEGMIRAVFNITENEDYDKDWRSWGDGFVCGAAGFEGRSVD